MHRILIVEDDPDIVEVVRFYLEEGGEYALTAAASPAEALLLTRFEPPFDLILLDIMLPGLDGIALCGALRQQTYCPIIFISCLDDEDTIVKALRMGGDDYLVKPFKGRVLLARVEANLRRTQLAGGRSGLRCQGDFVLDMNRHTLKGLPGEEIYLSPTEFDLFSFMLDHEGELLEAEALFEAIWHRPSNGDVRTVWVHVSNLRKKIEPEPAEPLYIKTVKRIGYIFHSKVS